jgi:hypothetical protein
MHASRSQLAYYFIQKAADAYIIRRLCLRDAQHTEPASQIAVAVTPLR